MKTKFKRNIYTKNDAGNAFLMGLIAPQIVASTAYFILAFVGTMTGFANILDSNLAQIVILVASQISFLMVFFAYNLLFGFNFKSASKIHFDFGWKNLIIAILMGLITLFGFSYLISFVDSILNFLGHTSSGLPLPLSSIGWLFVNLLLLAVLPAVCEELLFRGIIFNGLKQHGVKIAIIGSALLFALIHANVEQTIYPIVFGIVLAVLAYKTNSVIPAIAAHFTNNALVLILNFFAGGVTIGEVQTFGTAEIVMAFAFAIASSFALWGLSKLLKRQTKHIDELEKIKNQINNEVEAEIVNPDQTWANIITENNDLSSLEVAEKTSNKALWIGVSIGLLFWTLSLFI